LKKARKGFLYTEELKEIEGCCGFRQQTATDCLLLCNCCCLWKL